MLGISQGQALAIEHTAGMGFAFAALAPVTDRHQVRGYCQGQALAGSLLYLYVVFLSIQHTTKYKLIT